MSQFYKVIKADPLGEPWTPSQPGAKAIQNYWCQVEGEELAVSIGKQVDNPLVPGQQVYGDLMKARSQKGTDYWKFKGQKVPDGVQRPPQTTVNVSASQPDWFQPYANMLTDVYKMVKELHGGLEKGATVEETATESIDKDTLAVINEIFPTSKEEPKEE